MCTYICYVCSSLIMYYCWQVLRYVKFHRFLLTQIPGTYMFTHALDRMVFYQEIVSTGYYKR